MPSFQPGTYLGRVVSQELGKSSKAKTPQVVIRFEILDELDAMGEPCGLQYRGETRSVYLYLKEGKSIEISLKALKLLGFSGTSFGHLDPENGDFQDLSGTEAKLYCKHEEYEGEMQERWGISTPRDSQPLEASDLKKVDALFGRALKAQAAPEPQPEDPLNKALQEAASINANDESPF